MVAGAPRRSDGGAARWRARAARLACGMVDALLCELEGVLFETARPRAEALRRALQEEGLALEVRAAQVCASGHAVPSAVQRALQALGTAPDPSLAALLVLRAERHFAALAAHGLAFTPGARDFLERAAAGTRLAAVTRATRREADMLLALGEIADHFEVIITSSECGVPKPHHAAYERALQRLGARRAVAASRTAALEDGAPGARSARGAGVPCIVVGAGLPAHDALEGNAWLPSLAGAHLEMLAALLASPAEQPR